jgi:hypothetical protein
LAIREAFSTGDFALVKRSVPEVASPQTFSDAELSSSWESTNPDDNGTQYRGWSAGSNFVNVLVLHIPWGEAPIMEASARLFLGDEEANTTL